jgi:hypothetical protein
MTDEATLDRLIGHLRGQVAELRRLEREGAEPGEIAEAPRCSGVGTTAGLRAISSCRRLSACG